MTLPDEYESMAPWMAAHKKVCPGEGSIRVVARMRKPKLPKAGAPGELPKMTPDVDAAKFVSEAGERAARDLLNGAINLFFKGKLK